MTLQEQKERDYQNTLVKRFQEELGYKYLGNLEYVKGATVNSAGQQNSPILDEEVRSFLKKQGRTDMQIEDALRQLKNAAYLGDPMMSKLTERNLAVYELLKNGVKSQPSPDRPHEDVAFFDFNNINNNTFAIAEEVSYIDPLTCRNKRPDIVVYVNGIALAVIELKRSLVNYEEGIKQHLSNERDFIPSFFTTTQFTVASNDGVEFRYGTVGTPLKFWCKWKKDTTKLGDQPTEAESYNMFFNKENFMFFFRYGVLNDGGVKKVLRPHQVYAIKAAAARMPQKDSGVIWHSQGSGKSLTMVALAAYIRSNFPNPRVLVITDRKELDLQLGNTFVSGGNTLHRASSNEDLLKTLNKGEVWLICSLIHKFGARNNDDEAEMDESGTKVSIDEYLNDLESIITQKYPNGFSVKGDNIFVFVDECHRTQSGRLHEAMTHIMGKDVMLIGFTGTPLLAKDKKKKTYDDVKHISEYVFGSFIHKYLHKQGVEDGVILDLQYEYRNVEQQITSKEKLDEKLARLTAGRDLNEEQKKAVEDRWATMEKIYSTHERIERIGFSILDDLNYGLIRHDWANAMLVAGSIYQAYRYFEFFYNHGFSEKCAVVTSYDPADRDLANDSPDNTLTTEAKYKYDWAKKSFAIAGVSNADQYEAWAKKKFIKQPGQMKLLIVVSKLLTGFDAPCATVLYIDNAIKDHTLFQAICRVNRLGEDIKDERGNVTITHKEFGRIIDYKNLFKSIENVITTFNDGEGFSGFEPEDVEGLLGDAVAKCRKKLEAAAKAFEALKVIWESKGLNNLEDVAEYYLTDYPDDPAPIRRKIMYAITGDMVAAYNNMSDYFCQTDLTQEQIEYYHKLASEAGTVHRKVKQKSGDDFDPRTLDPDMRQLLDQHVRANDSETLISADADFSFLDLIDENSDTDDTADKVEKEAKGNKKGAAEVMEGKARRVNTDWNSNDEEEYMKFSEQLEELLKKLKEENASAEERIKALINYIKSVKKGTSIPAGLNGTHDYRRCKALWNNRASWGAPSDDNDAVAMIIAIDDYIYYDAGAGWKDPNNVSATELKDDLSCDYPTLTNENINTLYTLAALNS